MSTDNQNDNDTDTVQLVGGAEIPVDIDAFLQSLGEDFEYAPTISIPSALSSTSTDDDDDDDDDNQTDDDAADDDGTTTDDHADSITVNGNVIPLAEVQRLVEFDTFLKANPVLAQRMADTITQPAGLPSAPKASETSPSPVAPTPSTATEFVPPTPPETLDLDDPSTKFLWDELVATRKQAFDAQQSALSVASQSQASMAQLQARQAELDMTTALSNFQTTHPNINADDITKIRKLAAQMNILPGMMATMPPVDALYRSMEVAAYADADVRPKMLDPEFTTATTADKSTSRKRRLGQISSSSGNSAPRNDSAPRARSDREMINEFARELSESGFGRN